MRMTSPSPGEAYDRITILNLKILAAERKGNEGARITFGLEFDALTLYMSDKHWVIPTPLADELAKINTRLWDLENTQRELLKKWPPVEDNFSEWHAEDEFARNALTVLRLNDARAETVQKINKACNVEQLEKIYDSQ